jgi:hypothetical protein
MMCHLIRWSILGFSSLVLIAMVGCARSITVVPPSIDRQDTTAQSVANEDRVPFVMDTFHLLLNGAPQNPSSEIERRILNTVQRTHLFSTLVPLGGHSVSVGNKVVTARITFDETIDPHAGQTALKGILVGASMFLLSPVIELDYDYSAQTSLELERWDGQLKHYAARSSGTVRYNLFGATPIMIDELKGHVTEACLHDLINQLVQDADLYLASSTALSASTIRTVTVETRRPETDPAVHPSVPVTAKPAP